MDELEYLRIKGFGVSINERYFDANFVNLIKPKSNYMKPNIDEIGIIDEVNNPFGRNKNDWIKKARGFTEHRRTQLMPLLNRNANEVLDHKPENESRYPAFVAVRWGFAKLSSDNKLISKRKLDDYELYNSRGQKN